MRLYLEGAGLGSWAVDRWDSLVSQASHNYDVPAEWIKAVIQVESSGNPDAYNPNDPEGARGLMQIIGPTARAYGVSDLSRLFDPVVNVAVGTELLSDLRRRFGDDFRRVYSAYNSGNPDLWQTSYEVAGHVEKAVMALGEYLGAAAGETVAAVNEGSPWAIVGVGIVLLMAGGRRRRGR